MTDPYVYHNSNVLINKLDIKDADQLNQVECDLSLVRIQELQFIPRQGTYDFDNLCEYHHHIFQDIYEWAGNPRVMNIEKAEPLLGGLSIEYGKHEKVVDEAKSVLANMKESIYDRLSDRTRAECIASDMASLWKVHPFREGNTRTIVNFMCDYVQSLGIAIDRTLFSGNTKYLSQALVAASCEFSPDYVRQLLVKNLDPGLEEDTRIAIDQIISNPHRSQSNHLEDMVSEALRRGKVSELTNQQEKFLKNLSHNDSTSIEADKQVKLAEPEL